MIHVHYGCSNNFTSTLTEHSVDWQSCVPEEVDAYNDEVIIPVSIDEATGIFNFPSHEDWSQDEEIFFCFIDESRGIICNNYNSTGISGEFKCVDYINVEELFEAAKEDKIEAESTDKVESTGTTSSTVSMRRRRRRK
jgi:hypothetical protein